MLQRLEKLFKNNAQPDPSNKDETLKIATTALFLEMAYADFNIDPQEEKEIESSLKNLFGMETSEISDLIQEAKEERQSRSDIWGFTNIITDHFNREECLDILDKLWMLIYADGRVDKYEDALIRKMTGLLGLEHADMIQAKLKIRKQFDQ